MEPFLNNHTNKKNTHINHHRISLSSIYSPRLFSKTALYFSLWQVDNSNNSCGKSSKTSSFDAASLCDFYPISEIFETLDIEQSN